MIKHDADIRDVSDTAMWVAYYRGKESNHANALFRDPLAMVLASERGERIAESFQLISTYAEWTVISRTVLIDEFILREINHGLDAVVNLGAGLDTRPYRMQLPPSFLWVEADFPHMIEYKKSKLHGTTPLCQVQSVGVDLSDAAARKDFLDQAAQRSEKVLILTEGVIPYLTEEQVAELAADLRSQPRFAFWLAEYIFPEMYIRLKAASQFAVLANAPFRFFPQDWKGFFLRHGWENIETRFPSEVARRFGRAPQMSLRERRLLSGVMLMAAHSR